MKKLLATFIITIGIFTPFYNANAVSGSVGCGPGSASLLNATYSALSTVGADNAVPTKDKTVRENTTTSVIKECILDGLVPALRQALITTITNNIVNWINSGFDGAPAFVTDLNGFLGEVADNTELDFILGDELGFLCSPFELDVRLALAVGRQPFRDRVSCSLSDVSNNIQGFFDGDFSQGGWPAWFRLSTDISNTPIGAYYEASVELGDRKIAAVEEQRDILGWGDGFFSPHQCFGAESAKGGEKLDVSTQSSCEASGGSWEIVTPGTQINSQLTNVLGSGLKQLELADEIDEIINALLAQLGQQIFTSADGLRGLSNPSSSSSRNNQSYLSALAEETSAESVNKASAVLIADINGSIQLEETYQGILSDLISGYQVSSSGFTQLYQCYTSSGASTNASIASSTLNTQITPSLNQYENQLQNSYDTVSQLISIRGEAQRANTTDELNAVADSYDDILSSGVIHTGADISLLNQTLENSQLIFDGYGTQIELGLTQCGIN